MGEGVAIVSGLGGSARYFALYHRAIKRENSKWTTLAFAARTAAIARLGD